MGQLNVEGGEFLGKERSRASLNSPLSKVFQKTATSYKFLFFKTILDILGLTGNLKEKRASIPLKHFYLFFLVNSWYPISTFKLSFGKIDQIGEFILNLKKNSREKSLLAYDIDYYDLDRILIHTHDAYYKEIFDTLDKFVKYRFLTPYMTEELRGIKDEKKNDKIRELLEIDFKTEKKYPYHFDYKNEVEYLVINSTFDEYVSSNFAIIYDWWRWNFAEYLSKKNPFTPAILFKIESPKKRNLANARIYWNSIIQLSEGRTKCIYSGKIINSPKGLSLDHFLPWSFLPNDQIWNIIPTINTINSSKSDNLPTRDYIEKFIDFQIESLSLYVANIDKPVVHKISKSTLAEEFKVSESVNLLGMLQNKNLRQSYNDSVVRYYNMAEEQGFSSNWKYELSK